MDKRIVVLTRSYSTALGVIRALGQAGNTVDLIMSCRNKQEADVISCSKFINKTYVIPGKKSSSTTENNILKQLDSYKISACDISNEESDASDEEANMLGVSDASNEKNKIILFPTDDYSAMLVDKHREELSQTFIMPYVVSDKPQAMMELMNKSVQSRLAAEAGMPGPKEWTIDLENFSIPSDMVYPCFCKPLQSAAGYKTEMKKCENEKELAAHLGLLKDHNEERSILVQEFIDIETEISMSGVCIDQEIILPALVKKSHVAKYERGVTLAGCLVPPDYLGEEIEEKIKAVLRKFRYVGMFDMEILLCKDGYYFGEVNLRSGGPNFAYTINGANLPETAVLALTGEPRVPEYETVDTFGRSFVYEKVAWEDYLNFCMKKKELYDLLNNSESFLLKWDKDPAPGRKFARKMQNIRKKERLKALCKRSFLYSIYQHRREVKRERSSYKYFMKVKKSTTADMVLRGETAREVKNKRVIILSRNYCSLLTMIRALANQGYYIDVVRIFQVAPRFYRVFSRLNPEGYSKYIRKYKICVTNRKPEVLVNLLKKMYDPALDTMLIPADDLPMSIIDNFYEELKEYFILPNVDETAGLGNIVMQKGFQKSRAPLYGLNVVNCNEVTVEDGKYTLSDTISYPCFIKPNVSVTSSKEMMRRCDSKEELTAAMDEIAKKHPNFSVLAEGFLEIENEYALLGLAVKDKVVLGGGMLKFLDGGSTKHIGVCMNGEVISTEPMNDLMEQIRAFIRSLNFTGLFDVDLLEAGGKIYFCELNLRFGASGYAITKSGVNLPAMMADYFLLGTPIDENAVIDQPGRRFVSEKVLIEAYGTHDISRKKLKESLQLADVHFIMDEEDPEPYEYFEKYYNFAYFAPVLEFLRRKTKGPRNRLNKARLRGKKAKQLRRISRRKIKKMKRNSLRQRIKREKRSSRRQIRRIRKQQIELLIKK